MSKLETRSLFIYLYAKANQESGKAQSEAVRDRIRP